MYLLVGVIMSMDRGDAELRSVRHWHRRGCGLSPLRALDSLRIEHPGARAAR
ncbi:hypothetical protein BN2537_11069 [Streptomyces venezuelae]|nr:hypothetical protein BN2537_11069 [Streptomyces venezuelae]